MRIQGGKSVYGAAVGILMLDTLFPRIPGDIGNAATFPFPVHYKVVRGASPDRVVLRNGEGLIGVFIEAAKELESEGVDGITTSCGFLSQFQEDLTAAVSIPVLTSSLMQVELVNRMLRSGKRAGILTISSSNLTDAHLARANVPLDTPIGSTEGGKEFTPAVLGNRTELDVRMAREDNIDAARRLQADHPEVGALVLECTNMTPFAADIRDATGLPVFSIVTLVNWFQSGLAPHQYANEL